MNWEEIDKIKREVPELPKYERRKHPPSVDKIIGDFDKLACEGNPTEADFHKGHEETKNIHKPMYLQKALRKTLRWQSFCAANT